MCIKYSIIMQYYPSCCCSIITSMTLWEFLEGRTCVGMETNWCQRRISGMLLFVVRRSYGYFCLPHSASCFSAPALLTSEIREWGRNLPFCLSVLLPTASPLLLFMASVTSQNQPSIDPHTYNTVTAVCVGRGSMASQSVHLTPSVL